MEDEEHLVMNCLLSMSHQLPNTEEQIEPQYWSSYQNGDPTIVFRFDNDEGIVSVPGQYKVEKYQITQNLTDNDAGGTNAHSVLIENQPQHFAAEVSFVETPMTGFDESIQQLESYHPAVSAHTESSSSESIDVEVEDSDHIDELRNAPPEIITPTKKGPKKAVAAKRKVKRTKGWLKKNRQDADVLKTAMRKQAEEGKPEALKYNELTELEDNADQVAERFLKGCECVSNCFERFSAEKVFRHRLNIADLTKAEHDMYLMGVIHSSMQNPEATCRKKERLRIRSTYAYYGKKVCLTAFLYLEHVTLYQMKRIRKHLQNLGVTPRIHGNHGRKPFNTLPLDIYQQATKFVQDFIEQHCQDGTRPKNSRAPYRLPADYTKKTLHDAYRRFCAQSFPSGKIMQYSTFTNFFKKQFPHVKFRKIDKFAERRSDDKRFDETDGEDKQKKRFRRKMKPPQTSEVLGMEQNEYLSSPYAILRSEVMFNGDAPLFVHGRCDVKCEEVVESTIIE